MIRKEGKVFRDVFMLLRRAGMIDLRGLAIATLGRGPDHLVVINDTVIGEYNHVSGRLFLYEIEGNN